MIYLPLVRQRLDRLKTNLLQIHMKSSKLSSNQGKFLTAISKAESRVSYLRLSTFLHPLIREIENKIKDFKCILATKLGIYLSAKFSSIEKKTTSLPR